MFWRARTQAGSQMPEHAGRGSAGCALDGQGRRPGCSARRWSGRKRCSVPAEACSSGTQHFRTPRSGPRRCHKRNSSLAEASRPTVLCRPRSSCWHRETRMPRALSPVLAASAAPGAEQDARPMPLCIAAPEGELLCKCDPSAGCNRESPYSAELDCTGLGACWLLASRVDTSSTLGMPDKDGRARHKCKAVVARRCGQARLQLPACHVQHISF